MRDIVATIQAEQDHVIRADLPASSSSRAARAPARPRSRCTAPPTCSTPTGSELAAAGVLVVGPNPTFLRLHRPGAARRSARPACCCAPSASSSRASTPGGASRPRPPRSRAGRRWPTSSRPRSRDRQEVPDDAAASSSSTTASTLRLDRADLRARPRPGPARRPAAQPGPRGVPRGSSPRWPRRCSPIASAPTRTAPTRSAGRRARRRQPAGRRPTSRTIRRELAADPAVRRALDRLWPVLTPQRLLARPLASPTRLAAAAPELTAADRALLRRDPAGAPGRRPTCRCSTRPPSCSATTTAPRERAAERPRRAAEVAYAQGVLDDRAGLRARSTSRTSEPEILTATDLLDAGRLAERHERADTCTAAERAAGDRTGRSGTSIVDEAQELSAMAWRLLMRRCPSRSMTVVGDVAQTGGRGRRRVVGGGARAARRRPLAARELTVNYRTPGRDHGGRRRGPAPASTRRPRPPRVGARGRRAAVGAAGRAGERGRRWPPPSAPRRWPRTEAVARP